MSERDLTQLKVEVVLEEYKDLRDEIKTRLNQRTSFTWFMLAAVSAAFGFIAQNQNQYLLYIPTGVTVFITYLIESTYVVSDTLSKFIRLDTEHKINMLLGKAGDLNEPEKCHGWLSWETYYREDLKLPGRMRQPFYLTFLFIVYIAGGSIMTYYSYSHGQLTVFPLNLAVWGYWLFYALLCAHFTYLSQCKHRGLDLISEDDRNVRWGKSAQSVKR